MINQALLCPRSVAVVGASNQLSKPGGRLLHNLLAHNRNLPVYAVNPRESEVQGLKACASVSELPAVDLAFLAIPAAFCTETMQVLAAEKQTRAFVVLSAGFAESGCEGKQLETELLEIANRYGASLIGPNCIGLITPAYAGVFTTPVPPLAADGIDFISGSGATAVFTIESGMKKGLRFSSVYSLGNSTQIGVEEVLEHLDRTFDPGNSPRVKLLYLEAIRDPQKLLTHARSLVLKGCRLAAVKAGTGESGSRAAQSHTGALASPDEMVDALFRKAGIIRCFGREELTTVAGVLMLPELRTNQLAVITHAGGPAVMLTDALEKGGFAVPPFPDSEAKSTLKEKLYPGSSVENPIDFLATGTAEQLGEILSACDTRFDEAAGMVVIFGSPGLAPVNDVYRVLANRMKQSGKPIFPVLPSVVNAEEAIAEFIGSGLPCFPDEVSLAQALVRVGKRPVPEAAGSSPAVPMNRELIRLFCTGFKPGFLEPAHCHALLDVAGISRAREGVAKTPEQAAEHARRIGFPLAMKVIGPLHKSDVGGVLLHLNTEDEVRRGFHRLMHIDGARGVLLAEMLSGTELYVGAKYEPGYGHLVLAGLGGIWLEAMKDVQSALVPVSGTEAATIISNLKGLPLLQGKRGQTGVSVTAFADLIGRVSALLEIVPEIREMDFNPVFGKGEHLHVADVRIRFEPLN